jgi:uracil-DNA glycosylase
MPPNAQSAPQQVTPRLPPCWLKAVGEEFQQPYMHDLRAFLIAERAEHTVFPPMRDLFNAFWHTPLERTRVVILGQDPYHGEGQAHGLCFSVRRGVPPPPSLLNIYRELERTIDIPPARHGDLTSWADQGVLLLNSVLTVRAHAANSHRGHGWERFTDRVVEVLNAQPQGLIFLLWGTPAAQKAARVDASRHLVLRAPHPSPLSAHRGFLGCDHFRRANQWLEARGETPIDWSLPP